MLQTKIDWINESRQRSESRLLEMNLPDRKDENYRYLSFKGLDLLREANEFKTDLPTPSCPYSVPLDGEGAFLLLRSALPAGALLGRVDLPEGVVFCDILTAAQFHAPLIRKKLELSELFRNDFFAQLTSARWLNGVFLYVREGVEVQLPVRGVHYFDLVSGSAHSRTLIIAEAGSKVSYTDEFTSSEAALEGDDRSRVMSSVVQVFAEEGAQVSYNQIQTVDSEVHFFSRVEGRAGKKAKIRNGHVCLGGASSQVRLEGVCEGEHSSIFTKGAARGDGKQNFDFWQRSRHLAPNTESGVDYWAAMAGRSQSTFNGTIEISAEGQGTDAYQKSYNMLLSDSASIQTLPKLEIATDDVKCAHGASIAEVDPEQLYYLQSRGIDRKDAERMLIHSFTWPAVEALPHEVLRNQVTRRLSEKSLGGLES